MCSVAIALAISSIAAPASLEIPRVVVVLVPVATGR
jgi:hypothetical protein